MAMEWFKKALGIKSDADVTEAEKKKAAKNLGGRETNSGNIMQKEMLKKELKQKNKYE